MKYNVREAHKYWKLRERFISNNITYIDHQKMVKRYICGYYRGPVELIVYLVIKRKKKQKGVK